MKSLISNYLIPVSVIIILSSMAGCNKKAEEVLLSLNTNEITLKPNQTFNLIVSPDASGCVFRSDNDTIAEVYASGEIIARKVGVTNIYVTNSEKGYHEVCKVIVTPEYTMYREPYLGFGTSKENIKFYETRQMVDETDSTILYNGENSLIDSLTYSIENSTYTSCICGIPSDQVGLLDHYLSERYIYIGYIDVNLIARRTINGKAYVVTQVYSSSEILVYYFPKTGSSKGTGLTVDSETGKTIEGFINKIKKLYPKD
jgi:hypothetical protein